MLRLLLLLAYPPLAHAAIATGSPILMGCALLWLVIVALLYPALRARRPAGWLGLAACAATVSVLAEMGGGFWMMVSLSTALPASVAVAFLLSLRPGRTPIITNIAIRLQDPLPTPAVAYTRRLTAFWALLIVVLMGIELTLAVTGTRQAWSRFANGYVYLVLAATFLLEYGYRRVRFRGLPQPDLSRYLKGLLQVPHLRLP